jgi:polysaccharide chain length determinant protein (PEP-CTERM system associated)
MNLEAGFQLSDFGGIVRRRARVVLGVALLVALAAYWLAMALPNEYGSYATVLVEPQSVDPGLVEAGVPQADLNRRLHLMAAQILSRPRLSRIIDELGLYEDESKYLVRDEVINLMRDQITVEPVIPEMEAAQGPRREASEIDQFRIHFQDDDPVVARDVAQRLANDFIEEHIASRVRVSQKSLEFIEAELQRLAGAIRQVEAQVADLKAANSGRLPEDVMANQRRLERITTELAALRREIAAARSDEAFFHSQSATARELVGRGGVVENNTPESRIQLLELAIGEFESRGLTDKHPDVIRARKELELLRQQVEADGAGARPTSFAEHSAEAEAQRAQLRRIHAEEELGRLEVSAQEVQQLLNEAPEVAEQLDGLEREYRHLFQSYQDFSARRLEAGVQADLERRQLGEQFRVLEAAFLAPNPSSPNRLVIVAVGVFFGLALGAAIGIVLEAADASVHTARQLQLSLDLPVLAAIPQIWLEQDRLRLRRRRIRTAAATLALVVFALAGGAVNYWWVNGSVRGEEPTPAAAPGAAPAATPGGAAAAPPAEGA